ncbi:hypothetical protein HanIR_Chr14g0702681 [Helianthus annuus]|nr:hypothetical protein HanIR_Chr14g0702681 [Helianthus annuus]
MIDKTLTLLKILRYLLSYEFFFSVFELVSGSTTMHIGTKFNSVTDNKKVSSHIDTEKSKNP